MRLSAKTFLAACGALLFCAAPALANAERVYFLVGMRHVYRIGADMYAHVDERKQIEQDYADQVAADHQQYDKAVAAGGNTETETKELNAALTDLAVERDERLSAIYEKADYERDRHPELMLEADGPYQVIGFDTHRNAEVEVVDHYVVYRPWPGYYIAEPPYGWSYGVVYAPGLFIDLYWGWHSRWFGWGCPAFIGFWGHHGPLFFGGFSWGRHGEIVRGFGHDGFHRGFGGVNRVIGNGGHRSFSRVGSTHSLSHYNYNRSRTNFGPGRSSFGSSHSFSRSSGSFSHSRPSGGHSSGGRGGSFGRGRH
jgi:hypothetical protein